MEPPLPHLTDRKSPAEAREAVGRIYLGQSILCFAGFLVEIGVSAFLSRYVHGSLNTMTVPFLGGIVFGIAGLVGSILFFRKWQAHQTASALVINTAP